MKANEITSTMCEALLYDENTGVFKWAISPSIKTKKGAVAGTLTKHGYVLISIKSKGYMAHRLAYTRIYGEQDWDKYEIDHINGVRTDNSILNLRLVSRLENMKNKKEYRNNKSGHVGVYWNDKLSKWQGQVRINKKPRYAGVFDSKEDCINAVILIREEHKFHNNHGRKQ